MQVVPLLELYCDVTFFFFSFLFFLSLIFPQPCDFTPSTRPLSELVGWLVGWLTPRSVVSEEVLTGTEIPGGGERGRLYLTLHCHHQNDSRIKMGSDESRYNVSLTVRDSHKTVSTAHNF